MTSPGAALWITAEPPSVHGGGGNIRQAHLLARLASVRPTDLLVTGGEPDADLLSVVRSVHRLENSPARLTGALRRRTVSLGRALLPAGVPGASLELSDAARHLDKLRPAVAARGPYDLVIVEHTGLGGLVRMRRAGERWVLTAHNVQSVSYLQAAAELTGRRRWLARRTAAQARAFERSVCARYDLVLSVSDDDARSLPVASTVVPNGVDTRRFVLTRLPPQPVVLFSGTFSYAPNVDGAHWLCTQVWPLVRARLPTAVLHLVGRDPIATVRALTDLPGVMGMWDVPDVRPHLTGSRVAVVPLRSGSGTRLKALEAMAAGRPVVGTTIGLAGLGVIDGRDALVRDDAIGFAAAVVDLLLDNATAERLAQGGQMLASGFSWDDVGDRFLAAVLV